MSLGVNRNTPSPFIQGKQQAKSTNAAQGAGQAAKAAPTSGGDKTDKNDQVKDIANISTDLQVASAATTIALFDAVTPGPPVLGTLAGIVGVEALSNTVNTLPATERMKQAAEQLAAEAVEAFKKAFG